MTHKLNNAEIHVGDALAVLPTLDPDSVDSIVTDPPYGLSFMGKAWDKSVPSVALWSECLRVLKPGGHLLAFAGTRTQHRMACAIEDAGFEIRDMIAWVYGSGFPKSLNVALAIDKQNGSVGNRGKAFRTAGAGDRTDIQGKNGKAGMSYTAPATHEAQQWQGWGTSLKPSFEPVTVARKPILGTVAANVLEHGTGAINVDGCRVGTDGGTAKAGPPSYKPGTSLQGSVDGSLNGGECFDIGKGRWPANLIHDWSDEVVGLFPVTQSPTGTTTRAYGAYKTVGGAANHRPCHDSGITRETVNGFGDQGSAARFFYVAKCSRSDRNEGLDNTRTVKYSIDSSHLNGGLSCKDASMALAESLKKATSESTTKWLIGESGESIMGLCPSGSLSTTLTAINRITPSEILNSLPPCITSGFIADASCETENGGSLAVSADRSSALNPTTISEGQAESARGARLVVSQMLSAISDAANWKPFANVHSTVKPTDLMRYLCRLVTPPGGTVLDCFAGSGSTGKAAIREGFHFIGIEIEPESAEIAVARIRHESAQTKLDI